LCGFEVAVEKSSMALLPLAIGVVKPSSLEVKKIAENLKGLLEFTQQFSVSIEEVDKPTRVGDVAIFSLQKRPLAIYLLTGSDSGVEWRLYDVMSEQMIEGKFVEKGGRTPSLLARVIADDLWPLLTSTQGSFSTVIAACKRTQGKHKKKTSHLYVFSPFNVLDESKQLVVGGNHLNFAPRWHSSRPQLFYSVHTPYNILLASISPGHVPHTIINFDGQNMTPAISKAGRIVISLSEGDDAHLYEYVYDKNTKKSSFVQLTHGNGQYISPSFKGEQEIIFCYIDQRGSPRIGSIDLRTKQQSWLGLGSGACPCVSPDGLKMAYCSRAGNLLQIFEYDFSTKKHKQVTFDTFGRKDEVSWSPCGSFLIFSVEHGASSRVACYHIPTKTMKFITPHGEHWSFPVWAPRYAEGIPCF
jgi:Tol biopolymer transport system component